MFDLTWTVTLFSTNKSDDSHTLLLRKSVKWTSVNEEFGNSPCMHSHVLLITANNIEMRYCAWSVSALFEDTNFKNSMSGSSLTPLLIQTMVIKSFFAVCCIFIFAYITWSIWSERCTSETSADSASPRNGATGVPLCPSCWVSQRIGNGGSAASQEDTHHHVSPGREAQPSHLATN